MTRSLDTRIDIAARKAQCPWWCGYCRACHDNACPTLHGGEFVPGRCGHSGIDRRRARDAYANRDTELAHDMERAEAARPQTPEAARVGKPSASGPHVHLGQPAAPEPCRAIRGRSSNYQKGN